MGYWPREGSCGCGGLCGCVPRGSICVPRGDDARIIFSVYDTDGMEFDISGATEIVFVVADGKYIGSTIYPGLPVHIDKRLTDGEITIAGNQYEFIVDVTNIETAALPRNNLYYEAQITTSDGLKKTVSAGIFYAQDTLIKDVP